MFNQTLKQSFSIWDSPTLHPLMCHWCNRKIQTGASALWIWTSWFCRDIQVQERPPGPGDASSLGLVFVITAKHLSSVELPVTLISKWSCRGTSGEPIGSEETLSLLLNVFQYTYWFPVEWLDKSQKTLFLLFSVVRDFSCWFQRTSCSPSLYPSSAPRLQENTWNYKWRQLSTNQQDGPWSSTSEMVLQINQKTTTTVLRLEQNYQDGPKILIQPSEGPSDSTGIIKIVPKFDWKYPDYHWTWVET